MNKVIVSILGVAMLAGYMIIPALATHYEPNPPSSLLVSPPYGFVTHQPPDTSDTTIDSRSALRWPTSTTSVTYYTNMNGATLAPGFTVSQARQKIIDAGNTWYNTLSSSSSIFSLNWGGDQGADASLLRTQCGTGTSTTDGLNLVAFCSGIGSNAAAQLSPSFSSSGGITTSVTEVDMVFKSGVTWANDWNSGNQNITNTAMHEFGHWHGLGDLYKVYGFCGPSNEPNQIMCGSPLNLGWGDKDGIRWLYPKTQGSFALSPSGTITGADSGVTLIDGNQSPDMIFVWGDYSSSTGQTTIKAKGIWDISATTGSGTVGTTVTLYTVTGQVYDVGATIYNSVNSGTTPDLIVTYTTSATSYLVFWDLGRSSSTLTWTSRSGPYSVGGSGGDKGTDVVVFDMNGDGTRDLLVMDSYNPGTGYKFWYYYGTLSTSGTVASWTTGSSSNTISLVGEDIGGSIPYVSNRIGVVSDKDARGWVTERLLHFTTSGSIDASITSNKVAPLKPIGTVNGVGAGDAFNLGEQSYNEQFFSWVDTNTGYYIIDWDSRLNSHGG